MFFNRLPIATLSDRLYYHLRLLQYELKEGFIRNEVTFYHYMLPPKPHPVPLSFVTSRFSKLGKSLPKPVYKRKICWMIVIDFQWFCFTSWAKFAELKKLNEFLDPDGKSNFSLLPSAWINSMDVQKLINLIVPFVPTTMACKYYYSSFISKYIKTIHKALFFYWLLCLFFIFINCYLILQHF